MPAPTVTELSEIRPLDPEQLTAYRDKALELLRALATGLETTALDLEHSLANHQFGNPEPGENLQVRSTPASRAAARKAVKPLKDAIGNVQAAGDRISRLADSVMRQAENLSREAAKARV